MSTLGVPTAGVSLAAGGTSWSAISDESVKENIVPVDGTHVLDALEEVPISTWNAESQDPSIRHIGPMAQDFHAAFGVGEDDRHITTIDADGVALAAIQGLNEKNESLQTRIEELERGGSSGSGASGWGGILPLLMVMAFALLALGIRRTGGTLQA